MFLRFALGEVPACENLHKYYFSGFELGQNVSRLCRTLATVGGGAAEVGGWPSFKPWSKFGVLFPRRGRPLRLFCAEVTQGPYPGDMQKHV